METETGIVTYINRKKFFGFIQSDEDERLFFHETGVMGDFSKLKAGTEVEYMKVNLPRGKSAIGVIEK